MTTPNLAEPLKHSLRPLFKQLPIQRAMNQLVVTEPTDGEHIELVEQLIEELELDQQPAVVAGLWLYVDELDRSHRISQQLQTPTGSFWHAIMHRREGDFSNSKYWYRRTGKHPAMNRIAAAGGGAGAGTSEGGYDPYDFTDRVERAHRQGRRDPELVSLQHREWLALFEWCARQ